MGRRWRSRDEVCESDRGGGAGKPIIFLSSDDEEANEDLSLAIVNKARLREAKRKRAEDKEKAQTFFVDLSISSADDIDAVTNGKVAGERVGFLAGAADVKKKPTKRPKKKKKKKKEKEVEEETLTERPDSSAEVVDPVGTSDSVIEVPNETSNNLVLLKLLRGPRYFDPGQGNWETCFNCGEEGHIAANCKEERRQKPCFVCGMFGHIAKNCMQGQDCFICKRRGHHAKECPDKHKNIYQESIICLRCGDLGHDMASCRSNYAPDDLKDIQCYICKKYGHLCCADYKDKGPSQISCYNCAEPGHTGEGCAKQRGENTPTTPPTICYRCGQGGHIARGCTKNTKSVGRFEESSTPVNRMKFKKDYKVSKSLPKDFGREHKRESHFSSKNTRPVKSRIKGGWIVDDTGYLPKRELKSKDWASPSTPSGRTWKINSSSRDSYSNYSSTPSGRTYEVNSSASGARYSNYSSPHTPNKMYNCYAGTQSSRGFTGVYHHGFSSSRFGYS